jgi:uncharacterized membrane protein (Fun14 family)
MQLGQIGRAQVAPLSHGVSASMGLIIGLLVLWVVLAVIGFAVKSLFWLAIVGIILFIATGIFGAMRRRAPR